MLLRLCLKSNNNKKLSGEDLVLINKGIKLNLSWFWVYLFRFFLINTLSDWGYC